MKKISAEAMKRIVDLWLEDVELTPRGMFYCLDNEVWVGCDNVHGHCWMEEFKTEEDVIQWLNDEPVCNVNNYALDEREEEEA